MKSQRKSSELNKKHGCTTDGLKILGDFWTLAIIRSLSQGEKRFCQLQRDLNKVNPVTFTNRLKKLEEERIIQRNVETLDKLSVTYTLTKKGIAILPILKAVERFSKKYLE